MGGAARVQGVIGALGEAVCAAYTGVYLLDPVLQQLPGLIDEYNVVFCALVLPQVAVRCTVAKPYGAAVGEGEHLVRLVVSCNALQVRPQRLNVVVDQLLVGLSDNENAYTGVCRR